MCSIHVRQYVMSINLMLPKNKIRVSITDLEYKPVILELAMLSTMFSCHHQLQKL